MFFNNYSRRQFKLWRQFFRLPILIVLTIGISHSAIAESKIN
jgi:hypothetical protein